MDPVTARYCVEGRPDPRDFLASSRIIDHNHQVVREKACELAAGCNDVTVIAERCFLFVRDEVRHSVDFEENPVTLKASDVLRRCTGFCYAKSHLLAALLRANGIPAGASATNDSPSTGSAVRSPSMASTLYACWSMAGIISMRGGISLVSMPALRRQLNTSRISLRNRARETCRGSLPNHSRK
ncbi:MAG: transglutaminase family protein [Methanoregula sp.]|jgi:hypothetical protein|nr:transglutaminase family protein [Methanoregula sp.]